MKKTLYILLLIFLLLPSYTGLAHNVIIIEDPINTIEESFEIKDIEESKAIYGTLEEDEVHYYAFKAQRGQKFYSQIMVPNTDRYRNFMMYKIVFGPFEDTLPVGYHYLVEPHTKGYVIEPGNNRKKFFEPFTQTSYIKKQQFSLEIPEDGDYYIAVYNPPGQKSKYVLLVGEEESVELGDILRLPQTWFKVNYWINPLRPFSILFLVLLTIFIVVKILIKRKKKPSRF